MEVTVQLTGVRELLAQLQALPQQTQMAVGRAMTRIGLIAHREAVRNAPRSASAAITQALRKTKRKTRRNDRAFSRASPGGLERSIAWRATMDEAAVFVDANSEAGKYAGRIHDEKGISWYDRGPGTTQKGARADEKFIERAIYDNEGHFVDIIKSELGKVMP